MRFTIYCCNGGGNGHFIKLNKYESHKNKKRPLKIKGRFLLDSDFLYTARLC